MPSFDMLTLVVIISFFVYGTRCLFAEEMKREFTRWRVPCLRYITGVLEVLGSLGLVVGQWFPWLGFCAAAGLSLLMCFGVLVRIRIRDSLWQTLPAIVFLVATVVVAFKFATYL
jgi:uncharacterized membrane protein